MKRNIIFILTMTLLGIIFPVMSNIQIDGANAEISDAENTVVVADANKEEKATKTVKNSNVFAVAEDAKEDKVEKTIVSDAKTKETSTKSTETTSKTTYSEPEVKKSEPEQHYEAPVYEEPAYEEPVYEEPAPAAQAEPVYEVPIVEPNYVAPIVQPDHIEIGGKWINVYDVDGTGYDAGNSVYRLVKGTTYNGKFLYGHNSANVFGNLQYLEPGTIFSITINNETFKYKIINKVVFEKSQSTGNLIFNGIDDKKFMNNIGKATFYDGSNYTNYDLSIMTCHGQSLGNGDATHRLVIFANKI